MCYEFRLGLYHPGSACIHSFSFFPPPPQWLMRFGFTIYILLACLELRYPPASAFLVLVLKVQGFLGFHPHLDYCFRPFCKAVFSCCTWLVLILTPTPVTCAVPAALQFSLHVCCWRKPVYFFNEEWKSAVGFLVICWKSLFFSHGGGCVCCGYTNDSSVICFRTLRFYSVVFSVWHSMLTLAL